jgi:hypothetical protein
MNAAHHDVSSASLEPHEHGVNLLIVSAGAQEMETRRFHFTHQQFKGLFENFRILQLVRAEYNKIIAEATP